MNNSPIKDFLNDDPYALLENYAVNNNDKFKEELSKSDVNGDSIFINLLKKRYNSDFYSKVLELLYLNGYSLKNKYKSSIHEKYKLNKEPHDFVPEFVNAIGYAANDKILLTIAQKLDKDYFLEMEKTGWPVLELLYQANYPNTIRYVSQFGLNYDKLPSGGNLLIIAERNQKLVDLYWEIKNQSIDNIKLNDGMSEQQYLHFLVNLEKKMERVQSSKDNYAKEYISNIEEKLPLLNYDQKLEVLGTTLLAKDLSIMRSVAKLIGVKSNSTEIQKLTLLKCDSIQNKDLLIPIITNNPQLLSQYFDFEWSHDKNETIKKSGIELLNRALKHLEIQPFKRWGSSGRKNSANLALRQKLSEIEKNIMIDSTKKETLFDIILKFNDRRNTIFPLINITYQKMNGGPLQLTKLTINDVENIRQGLTKGLTEEQKHEINDILNITWRKNGGLEANLTTEVMGKLIEEEFFIINPVMLNEDIFTNTEKIKIFSELINYTATSGWNKQMFYESSTFSGDTNTGRNSITENALKSLYNQFIQNGSSEIISIDIKAEAYEKIKDSPFIRELQAKIMKENLSKELKPTDASKTKKMKI